MLCSLYSNRLLTASRARAAAIFSFLLTLELSLIWTSALEAAPGDTGDVARDIGEDAGKVWGDCAPPSLGSSGSRPDLPTRVAAALSLSHMAAVAPTRHSE